MPVPHERVPFLAVFLGVRKRYFLTDHSFLGSAVIPKDLEICHPAFFFFFLINGDIPKGAEFLQDT